MGIVEFIMYGCMKYFRECYMAASINISNPQIQFCISVTQYMQQKIEKAKLHRVIRQVKWSIDLKFYVRIELVMVSVEIGWYMIV